MNFSVVRDLLPPALQEPTQELCSHASAQAQSDEPGPLLPSHQHPLHLPLWVQHRGEICH